MVAIAALVMAVLANLGDWIVMLEELLAGIWPA